MTALTDLEKKLVEYVTRGDLLDLAGTEAITEEVMRSWDESRTIRAWVLRDIMRGRLAPTQIHTAYDYAAPVSRADWTWRTSPAQSPSN